jgi:hypothetical protein
MSRATGGGRSARRARRSYPWSLHPIQTATTRRRRRTWQRTDSKLSQRGAARATQATTLTLRLLQDGPSEGYRVESNGVPLGVIGRTYGVDTSRWYWSLSSISTPLDARGMSHPCGGGVDQVEALERLTAH